MVPPPQIMRSGRKNGLTPKLDFTAEGNNFMDGLSSSNRILLNKGMKPGTLPSLGNSDKKFNAYSTQIDPSIRLLQGPPATAMTAFEGGFSMN